jgi:hypothetical protein
VTATELEGKRLPPVCAMTGAPSETWRRFRFATLPVSAWMSSGPFSFGSERSAIGYLPLTRRSAQRLALITWVPFGAIIIGTSVAALSAITGLQSSDSTVAAVAATLLFLGLMLLFCGGVALLLTRQIGPQGKVRDAEPGAHRESKIVELSRVHPEFVAAVRVMHHHGSESG